MKTLRNLFVAVVAMVMALTFSIVGTADAGTVTYYTNCGQLSFLSSRICVDFSTGTVSVYSSASNLIGVAEIQDRVISPLPVGYIATPAECFTSGTENGRPITWIKVPSYVSYTGYISIRYNNLQPYQTADHYYNVWATPYPWYPNVVEYIAVYANYPGVECVVLQ